MDIKLETDERPRPLASGVPVGTAFLISEKRPIYMRVVNSVDEKGVIRAVVITGIQAGQHVTLNANDKIYRILNGEFVYRELDIVEDREDRTNH